MDRLSTSITVHSEWTGGQVDRARNAMGPSSSLWLPPSPSTFPLILTNPSLRFSGVEFPGGAPSGSCFKLGLRAARMCEQVPSPPRKEMRLVASAGLPDCGCGLWTRCGPEVLETQNPVRGEGPSPTSLQGTVSLSPALGEDCCLLSQFLVVGHEPRAGAAPLHPSCTISEPPAL